MLAGVPNASNARAAALWDLGRIAASDPALLEDVRRGVLPTQETAAGVAFRTGFAQLLESYGFTTTMHLIDLPTWNEDPAIPLAMITAMADEPEERSPQQAEASSKTRRLELEAALNALPDDEEIVRLRAILPVAQWLAPASEDHNLLCDQRMIAASRLRWLRLGSYLRKRGLLTADDDVFYVTIDELYAMLDQGAPAPEAIRERRANQLLWRATNPPARLGAGVDQQSVEMLKGIAASAGTYRGRARVVATLNDASALQPGEVLVAPATSPEWTPYFGVAGALVSATGSLLAHAAVVAREFGIPAVVGARGATQRIKTGDMLAIDGAAGTVTIEAS
jgi:pyruvate,water dikinase